MTPDPWSAPPPLAPGSWGAPPGAWAASPATVRRTRAPWPVQLVAGVCLLMAAFALVVGVLFVVGLLLILLAPLPLIAGAWLAVGSVMVLRGGRAGVVVLTGVLTLLLVTFVGLDIRMGGGVAPGPWWLAVLVALLWVPRSSRAWLWSRPPEATWPT